MLFINFGNNVAFDYFRTKEQIGSEVAMLDY